MVVCGQSAGRDSAPSSSSDRSVALYQTAVEFADKLHDLKLLGKSYYNLGASYYAVNDVDKAIESYEKSAEYFAQAGLLRDTIYVLGDLGAIYFNQENYQRAREYSERSIQTADSVKNSKVAPGAWPDDFGRARSLHTLAEIDLREGNHSQAIEKLQTALKLYQQLNGSGSKYDISIAGIYAAFGKVYPEIGDYAKGLFYLNKALTLVKAASDQDTTANILNSIGYLYMEQEDYAQAKEHFEQSLKIYLTGNNQIEAAKLYLNLGVIEQRQAHYDEAWTRFNLSLKEAKAAQITDAQVAASEGIGVVLAAKKDFAGALDALNRSLAIARETKNKTRQAELLWRSAQTYYEMGDYERSSTFAEDARSLARAMRLPKLEYLAMTTQGMSYAAQNKTDTATQTLNEATDQLELMRDEVAGRETELQLFLENKIASYHALVDLYLKQGKAADALVYAERAKGRVLLDVLSGGKAGLATGLTESEKAQLENLNRRISEINDRIRKGDTNSPSLNSLYNRLDSARLEYQSFENSLYITHSDLKIRSGHTPSITSSNLNEMTSDGNVAYLEYVAAKDHVTLFVVTKNKSSGVSEVKAYPLAIAPTTLMQKVNDFHESLAGQHLAYREGAHELYSLLIAPAGKQLRDAETLCIIPDSFLWNLPFQALLTPSERFVIEDHSIYYAPSLSVLREMNRDKAQGLRTDSSLIAFGNPVIGKDAQSNAELCPLPEAEQEVGLIAKSFGTSNKVLIGRDATENAFKTLAQKYSIIHLATHGVIDNRQPLYSHLLLTKTEGDPDNDGRLEARQIMNMNLPADLAVLSACETANGRIAPGEGVIGLSWAFFVAGTRATLVSQWKINSDSTSELMSNFYRSLNTNRSESSARNPKALREASLALIRGKRYSHPFYWAGFVLIGS